MKNISKIALSWLEIPSSERRAILVMIPFFTAISIFLSWMEDRPQSPIELNKNDKMILDSLLECENDHVVNVQPEIHPQKRDRKRRSESKRTFNKSPEYFLFDPNVISKEDYLKLGINNGQFKSIRKWIDNYGELTCKGEFRKLYVIDSLCYSKLEDYIDLPECSKKVPKKKEKFDLNSCDSLILRSVKGIGPSLSRRIIKYRDLLGGFVSIKQLEEVYGLDERVILELSLNVNLEKGIKTLDINSATCDELEKHPYIQKRIANAILKYRDQHGDYQALEDLYDIHLISDSLFLKIEPYLHTSNGITSKSSKSD